MASLKTIKVYDLLILLFICIASFFMAQQWGERYNVHSIYDIGFGFGEIIKNLVENNAYIGYFTHASHDTAQPRYSHRFPFIPFFVFVIGGISKNLSFILIIKNVLTWFGTWLILTRVVKLQYKSALVFLFLTILATRPSISLIEYEESFSPFFFIWLLVALEKRILGLFALSLCSLFLLKSSYWLPSLIMGCLWFFSCKDNLMKRLTPLLLILALGSGWSIWTHVKSGFIATPFNASSIDGYNLFKGVNPISNAAYPEYNNDVVDHLVRREYLPRTAVTEVEINKFWREKAFAIIKEDPTAQLGYLYKRLTTVISKANWSENNNTLRRFQSTDPAEIAKKKEQLYEKLSNERSIMSRLRSLITKTTQIIIFVLAIFYLRNEKKLWLLCLPLVYVLPNIFIFCEPRHLFILLLSLCFWSAQLLDKFFGRNPENNPASNHQHTAD